MFDDAFLGIRALWKLLWIIEKKATVTAPAPATMSSAVVICGFIYAFYQSGVRAGPTIIANPSLILTDAMAV